jgi:hypothetical protein
MKLYRQNRKAIVTVKHPVMQARETAVQAILQAPDEVRRSRSDPAVFLFYRLDQPGRWLCAVVRRLNDDGFLTRLIQPMRSKKGNRDGTSESIS